MVASLPPDEDERLKELRSYEILDTDSERGFDDITLLASQISGTPIAMISLVDEKRQWFKSKVGTSENETAREVAFCAHAILQTEVLEIRDAQADARFASNPLVTGETKLRFYAGAPLITSEGHALGALCVIDQVPRELSGEQKVALQALSRQVVAQLELRRSLRALSASEEKFRQLAENITDVFWICSPDLKTMHYTSPAFELLWGRTREDLYADAHQWSDAILPEDRERVLTIFATLMGDAPQVSMEYRLVRPDGTIRWVHSRGFQVRNAAGDLTRLTGIVTDITERKRSEEALVRQQMELRVLFDFVPAILCFKDTRNGILRVNQRAAKHFGGTVEEIEGKSFYELDPQRADGFYEDDLEVIQSGEPRLGIVEPACGPGGEELWLQKDKVPVFDRDGKVTGIVVMAQDITKRRTDEEKLQRQQTELQVLFDLVPALIWFKDTENNFLRANQRVVEATGKPIEEIEGKSAVEIYPQQAAGYYADDLEVIRSGVPKLGIVEKLRGPEGQDLWIQTDKVPYYGKDGKVVGIVVMAQDITERVGTEQSLRLLSSAVEQSKESIVITDAELDLPGPRILFVNPAFTQMTGYTAEEAIGNTPRILQGPLTDKGVLARLRENLERGEVFSGEAVNYRKNGKEFILEWQIAPLRDASGTVTHFVAIQRDISERKKLEAQLLQSQKMETVGKLAGGVAHEFNSILTAIIGQSELLLGDLALGAASAKSATEINKAAVRAASLTRQLLAYGRKQILRPEILDLNSILSGMESSLHHLMGRGVDVRIIPAPGLRTVRADAGQLEQVIMNMAMNAADMMPNGGKLTLETVSVTFDIESVGRQPELKPGNYEMLAITDTGAGMSEEVKARVFEPFFTTKAVGQGTGLGLSTCYGIIKQSGGHISVYSEVGRGATFKIYLPQVEPETKAPPQPLNIPGLPRGTETILLVEDDPALREMAATLLRKLGYTVWPAANGIEALTLKQQRDVGHVDLLFTDVVMPHMSGKELAERVRILYPHTRILFTSAYPENAIVHQGLLDPTVALLQKPFTPSALAHKVREALDQPIPSGGTRDPAAPSQIE